MRFKALVEEPVVNSFLVFILSKIFQKDSLGQTNALAEIFGELLKRIFLWGKGQSSTTCWEKLYLLKLEIYGKIFELKFSSTFLKIGLSLKQHVLTALGLILERRVEL